MVEKSGLKIQILCMKMKFRGPFRRGIQKCNFFQGGPNFGEGTAGKFGQNGLKQGNLLLYKSGGGQFQ